MTDKTLPSATNSLDSDDYRINNRIFFRLFKLANILQKQSVSILGVTTVQWAILGELARPRSSDGIAFSALADFLVVSRQNLDGVLRRLERDGYIERLADERDRRAKIVRLTASGRKFWNALELQIDNFYQEALSELTFDERVALSYFFSKVQRDLQNMTGPNMLE